MISVNPVGSTWKDARKSQPEKFSVYEFIKMFEDELISVTSDMKYDTSIAYYDRVMSNRPALIQYTENSPIPYFFKMSPNQYFLESYTPRLWTRYDTNSSIRDKFKHANKYIPRNQTFGFDKHYILFALQSINFRQNYMPTRLLLELIHWAETNKRYVLFKLHPFTQPDNQLLTYWKMLQDNGVIKKYAILVDHEFNIDELIDNAEMVWTYSSGVSLQAALKEKPVVVFTDAIDYAEICTICKSPAEAVMAKVNRDVDRFLSWYYEKLIIDVNRFDLRDQITSRIIKCVESNYDTESIFL